MPCNDGVTNTWFEWIYEKEDLLKVLVVEASTRSPFRPGGWALGMAGEEAPWSEND